ncbi:GNAT family N-acetyltransferase [Shewanella amazonensis]|uniref:Acetyltransferase, GNAT family n=1 Tax=Shewanella amazonensis (strain ATCC BAA-1098 / SB2B) TaxID=326297 RepID=A1S4I3_SHEAM|nr:GNAT family N-acetyltransferase [Shewanella amazonensis]ABL99289.1 acetyltransferase, GNAT family [Shewanella amazonensis SB2B]
MTPILTISQASCDEDVVAAADLIDSRDDNHHPLDRAALAKARLLLLARLDGRLVGCGAIKAGDGEVAELGYLVVASQYRRLGIGARLTQARIDWARAQGIKLLWATVRAENQASRENLLKAGWQFYGDYLSIRGTGNTIGWYVLPLQQGLDIQALMAGPIGSRTPVSQGRGAHG